MLAGGGSALAGLAALGSTELLLRGGGAFAASAQAAAAPAFVSRPDLRIPALRVTTAHAGTAPGLIMLAPYNAPHPAQAGALIVDNAGNPVWEQPLSHLVTTDFRVQTYRGQPVLTWWQGYITLGHGVGRYVIADSNYRPLAHVNAGDGHQGDLHEFLITERGTALLTSYAVTDRDLRAVGGSAHGTIQDAMFQEVDIRSGRVLFEWRSLNHIPIEESYWPVGTNWDYVHLNSIGVDSDANLLVSSRNTHTIYKLDRTSGAIIWRLGGKHSDFAIDPDAAFAWQHDARRQPDGTITVFDNGTSGASRALVLNVDESARRVSLKRAYTRPSPTFSDSQGNVQVLPNGNILIGWGAQPYVSEFSPDGELLFDARLGEKYISYRAYRMQWDSDGSGTPAVVARRAATHATAYVSWNGDTGVMHWTPLVGTTAGSLTALAPVARTGFETALAIPGGYTRLRVRGTDASGHTVTTSAVMSL
jgi:hypothetical protein